MKGKTKRRRMAASFGPRPSTVEVWITVDTARFRASIENLRAASERWTEALQRSVSIALRAAKQYSQLAAAIRRFDLEQAMPLEVWESEGGAIR